MTIPHSPPQVALVTGGNRGIGRAIARRLAHNGVLVAVHYARQEDAARQTVADIERDGGQAVAVRAELSSLASVDILFEALDAALTERTGSAHFDVLVNNAGIAPRGALLDTTEATFDEVFDLNVKLPFFALQRALPRLRDGGRIISISSGVTRLATPDRLAYAMTKGAVDVMTLALAKELGARGITVNAVAPGVVDTDMNAAWLRGNDQTRAFVASVSALGRVGEPEDVADIVAFFAGHDGRWVTGQVLDATGGTRL